MAPDSALSQSASPSGAGAVYSSVCRFSAERAGRCDRNWVLHVLHVLGVLHASTLIRSKYVEKVLRNQWAGQAEVRVGDAANFVVVAAVFCVVALGATVAPALHALRVDPLVALRHE